MQTTLLQSNHPIEDLSHPLNSSARVIQIVELLLGITKLKSVFRFTVNHSSKTEFSTDLFTALLTDKHNLIMAVAKGFIPLLFPRHTFCELQQLQCLHHGSTRSCFWSPLCPIPFSNTVQVMIYDTLVMALVLHGQSTSYMLGMLRNVFKVAGTKCCDTLYNVTKQHTHF